jgi:hypothetical protein
MCFIFNWVNNASDKSISLFWPTTALKAEQFVPEVDDGVVTFNGISTW